MAQGGVQAGGPGGQLAAGPVYSSLDPAAGGKGGSQSPTGTGVFGQYNGDVYGNSAQGLSFAQQMAHQMASGGGNIRIGAPSISTPQGGWGYDVATAGGIQGPEGYQAAQLANTNLDSYMNPYTSQVIDQTMSDLDAARLQAVNSTGYDATAQGAFGGSRHALREAQNDKDFYNQMARTSSQLRAAGFDNAQQAALTDVGMQNQASQFNLGQDMQTRLANLQNNQFNTSAQNQQAQFGQQSSLQQAIANQQAQTSANNAQAQLASQQMQQQLGAAQLLGNLSGQGFDIGQLIQQGNSNQGQFERNIQQALIDAAQGQFDQYTNQPAENQGILNDSLAPTGEGSTSTTNTPGIMDVISTAALVYAASTMSDLRLKDDVTKVGTYNGHNVYRWKWSEDALRGSLPLGPEIGVIAQEVAQTRPEAVREHPSGYLMVNYGEL